MRTKKGIVTSVAMDKTIVVSVHTSKMDEKYKKQFKTTTKFYAHDENNACALGDEVTINETAPLSKLKRWVVAKNEK